MATQPVRSETWGAWETWGRFMKCTSEAKVATTKRPCTLPFATKKAVPGTLSCNKCLLHFARLSISLYRHREVTATEVLCGPVAFCIPRERNVSTFGNRHRIWFIVFNGSTLCSTRRDIYVDLGGLDGLRTGTVVPAIIMCFTGRQGRRSRWFESWWCTSF